MFESMQAFVPAEWRGAYAFLTAPLAWIPDWHIAMINFAWYGDTVTATLAKRVLVLMPMLLLLVAVWSTMVSLYTLPFRSKRGSFLTTILLSWWETGRSIWFYWAGMIRLGVVVVGWLWAMARTGFRLVGVGLKAAFRAPLTLLDWTSQSYFKPGMPWVAFLALLLWCAVESTIFMYTLRPTLTEVLAGITGFEPNPALIAPILWLFLYFLILGSFACIQVLAEAIQNRRYGEVVQMLFVEFFVMFFEVIFLYRELIDAITPWIAQQTNESLRLGLVPTLMLASFGWVGVRGMTWFLFGRFGTPAVVAILARDTIRRGEAVPMPAPAAEATSVWRAPVAAMKEEIEWFRKEGQRVFELLSLPVLQLLAAGINFPVVVIMGRPAFELPFKTLNQILAAVPRWHKSSKGAKDPATRIEPVIPIQASGGAQ